MDEDKFLGPCKVCEEAGRKREDGAPNRLRIIDLKGGKRMYGCEGWNRDDPESPDSCQVSGPLPGRGYELWRLEERCSVCGERPRLTVKGFRGRPWKLCLNDDCPTMVEMREKRAERQAAKEAREAAKAAAEANGEAPADAEAATRRPAKGGGRRRRRKKPVAADGAHQAGPLEDLARPGGVFITLEGIDRSGKTTQAALLARRARARRGAAARARRHRGGRADPRAAQGPRARARPARRAAAVQRRPGRAVRGA